MKKILLVMVCAMFANFLNAHCGGCGTSNKTETKMKKAILLVTFGTSEKSARVSFENIEKLAKKRFPNMEIRWAYTAKFIRKKLKKEGIILDSPILALSKLANEGYESVIVQSLHTIPGSEFDELSKTVAMFKHQKDNIADIKIGKPLLANYANLDRVVDLMLQSAPKERTKDEGLVFMGHGTHHYANLIYVAFQALLNDKDVNAFIGTVEGNPTLDDIIKKCKTNNIKKVYLIPFMSVAGDHAKNDMASDEDDSWKSILKKEGILAIPILKGTAENDKIVDVWLDNCEKAMNSNHSH